MAKNGNGKVKVAVIEERLNEFKNDVREQFDDVKTQIKDVLNDHVTPLEKGLNQIKTHLAFYSGGLAVLTIVVPIIINLLTK